MVVTTVENISHFFTSNTYYLYVFSIANCGCFDNFGLISFRYGQFSSAGLVLLVISDVVFRYLSLFLIHINKNVEIGQNRC